MIATLNIETLKKALAEQHSDVFGDGEITQYGVNIPCPECDRITKWVEGDGEAFCMQPCGHKATPA